MALSMRSTGILLALSALLLTQAVTAAELDSDGDGLPDVWEFQNGYDELDKTDALKDLDGDGLSGREEYAWGTRGDTADSDGDGRADGREVYLGKSPVVADPNVLSTGFFHTCALNGAEVQCWGRDTEGQIHVPPLRNPVAVTAEGWHTCALDNTGVVCWGDVYANVPPLSHPVEVSAGQYGTCALDDTGVVCWGWNSSGQTNVPPLNNPVMLSAGNEHTCALDDSGVVCWGDNRYGQTSVPSLSNPIKVSSGGEHTCALDDTGVVCWGRSEVGQTAVPTLSNPVELSAGFQHSCALDDTGVVCWGRNEEGQTNVPPLINPVEVSAGMFHTCALDQNGLTCWGSDAYGMSTVPPLPLTSLLLDPQIRTFPRMVPLPDIDADSVADVAVVRSSPLRAEIRSGANGALIRAILLFDGEAVPIDLTALPDTDGDGSPELAVLGWVDSAFTAQIVNVGEVATSARTVKFGSTLKDYRGFTTAPDVNGNGAPELLLMAKDTSGQTQVQLRDGATGNWISTIPFGTAYDPVGIEVIQDQDGGGVPDLAMVGINKWGSVRATFKDLLSKKLVGSTDFDKKYPASRTIALDLDGDGENEVLGVLGENAQGTARAQLKHLPDGAAVSKAGFGRGFTAHTLFPIPDQDGNGQAEMVVLQSPGPQGIAHIRDASDGALVKQVTFYNRGMPRDAVYLPPSSVSPVGEIAYLAGEGGNLTLQVRGATTGQRRLSVALSTSAPSYTVSTQAGAGGSISPGSAEVQLGQRTTFTVTPDTNFGASATGCGGSLDGNTYTTGVITEACTVQASFAALPAATFSTSGFAVGSPATAGTQMIVGVRLTNADGSDPSDVAVTYTLPEGLTASGSFSCSYSAAQQRRTCSLTVTPATAGTYTVPFTATRSGEVPTQVSVSVTAT